MKSLHVWSGAIPRSRVALGRSELQAVIRFRVAGEAAKLGP
jgi:hypothetical protein